MKSDYPDISETNIEQLIFEQKRDFFDHGNTRSYGYRIKQLTQLKEGIKKYEDKILDALYADFRKPKFEAFTSEVGILYEEIDFTIKHLRKWMRTKKVSTPIVLELSKSKIIKEPKGVVLIIGPWNYPFQLLFSPLVGALAAGNCAVLKPSNETPAVANIIEKIINEIFPSNYISVIQGPGRSVGSALIKNFKWNHVFFTGSPQVGIQVAQMAASHLSPVTLELGGKSPGIIDKIVNIDKAAKRIVFGKFFNAGQTCVSPDYVLVHKSQKDAFVKLASKYIDQFYGPVPLQSENLAHIVNSKRMEVLIKYLEQGNLIKGGKYNLDERTIEPTLMDGIDLESPLMTEEIFGPILPIVEWEYETELIALVRRNRYPLACYIFTDNKKFTRFIIKNLEFGGGSVNNTLVHLVNPKLPFGGIGNSGMGNYHGKYSFDTFTHQKSILSTSTNVDLPLRYSPYNEKKLKWVKKFFK